jgi:hypothetical protein
VDEEISKWLLAESQQPSLVKERNHGTNCPETDSVAMVQHPEFYFIYYCGYLLWVAVHSVHYAGKLNYKSFETFRVLYTLLYLAGSAGKTCKNWSCLQWNKLCNNTISNNQKRYHLFTTELLIIIIVNKFKIYIIKKTATNYAYSVWKSSSR